MTAMVRALPSVVAYLVVVVWLTWPLAPSAGSGIVATVTSMDALYSMWAMAWAADALSTAPATLANAPIFHPAPDAFFYGPSALGALPLFAPVFWLTRNPVLATNVVYVGGLTLTAWAMHLVVLRWTASQAAALVAAGVVLTNPWLVSIFGPTTPHIVVLCWLPIIAMLAMHPAARMVEVLPVAALVVLQSLTEPVYVAPAVFAPLGTLGVLRLLRRSSRGAGLRLLGALALAALALAPLYLAYARVRRANPALAQQSFWPAVLPPTHVPFDLLHGIGPAVLPAATLLLVVAGVLALAWRRGHAETVALETATGWSAGALWTVVGVVISLSPVVLWNGEPIRTPVGYLPAALGLHVMRVPARVGVAGLVGIAILAGMAFAEIMRVVRMRVRSTTVRAVVAAGLAVAVLGPLQNRWGYARFADVDVGRSPPPTLRIERLSPPDPALLPTLAAIPGPILELPMSDDMMQGPLRHARAMYRAIYHRRPLLNGYSSYYPAAFPQRMRLAGMLPGAGPLAMLIRDTGLAGIWVHAAALPPAARARWLAIGEGRTDITLLARSGDELVFGVGTSR